MPSLAEIGAMVMEKKIKKKDGHRRTDGRTTDVRLPEKFTRASSYIR